jgi:hypothetical protein
MKELVGKDITQILINPDKTVIVFRTYDGDLAYQAEGDCCSESWFNHISNIAALASPGLYHVPATVLDIQQRDEKDESGTRQEEDKVYGYDLITNSGACYIELRNSSNGYYGGSISLTCYVNKEEMTPVKEDF